jgi:hypothetical protein
MPARRLLIHLPASRLLIGLLAVIVPICLAGLLSVAHAHSSLGKTVGNHFATIAEITASEVSRFIHDRVTDVGVMAIDSSVVDAVTAANARYLGKSDTAIAESIQGIEKSWSTPAAEPMAQQILGSRASQALRKHRDFDRRFLRITVTDEKGATVAATHKTLDYYQADEDFWQAVYANGRGVINITDVLYDDVTKSQYIGIGVPILDSATNRFIGMMDALVEVSAIFPVTQRMRFGSTARVMLVKDDGTVIAAPGITLANKMISDEFAAVRDEYQTISGRQTGYVDATLSSGRAVIGFADTGLKEDYGNLGWVVLAAQDTSEAFAPIHVVDRIVAMMSILGLLAVTLFAVWVSIHRVERFEHLGEVREPTETRTASV